MATLFFEPATAEKPVSEIIQRALDKVGTQAGEPLKYSEIHFSTGEYLINSRLFLNDNTVLSCDKGVLWKLADNVNFGEQVPVIGQKSSTISGLDISGINFNGNFTRQNTTPKDHGVGYGNFIGLKNVSNSKFHSLNIRDSEGDGFRIEAGKNLEFFDNKGAMGGHDFIHLNKSSLCKIYGNDVYMRANNVIRTRSSNNIEIFKNICRGTKIAYAPALQIENLVGKSFNISVHDNVITDSLGPGIELLASAVESFGVDIRDNKILKCGQMPKANKLPGVGGVLINGWDKVNVENNLIDGCLGYGVGFAKYIGGSLTGRTAFVRNNAVTNTKKANFPGVASGSGIGNLLKYKVTATGNKLSGNVIDCYNVKNEVIKSGV